MSLENDHSGSWELPKKREAPLTTNVHATNFWDALRDEASYQEVHYLDLAGTYLSLGFQMMEFSEGESFALRDNAGFETPLDFMDPRFAPKKPQLDLGKSHREMPIKLSETEEDLAISVCNSNEIELEELESRIMEMGIHVSNSLRDGELRLMHIKDGKRVGNHLGIAKPADRIKKFFELQKKPTALLREAEETKDLESDEKEQ